MKRTIECTFEVKTCDGGWLMAAGCRLALVFPIWETIECARNVPLLTQQIEFVRAFENAQGNLRVCLLAQHL